MALREINFKSLEISSLFKLCTFLIFYQLYESFTDFEILTIFRFTINKNTLYNVL